MSLFLLDIGTPAIFAHIPQTGGSSIRHERQSSGYRVYHPDDGWDDLPCFTFIHEAHVSQ